MEGVNRLRIYFVVVCCLYYNLYVNPCWVLFYIPQVRGHMCDNYSEMICPTYFHIYDVFRLISLYLPFSTCHVTEQSV
jgi:hypothetical protein